MVSWKIEKGVNFWLSTLCDLQVNNSNPVLAHFRSFGGKI